MATFGWVLFASAFIVLVMVANNSWPWVWAKLQRGIPQPGEGNTIVPNPPEGQNPFQPPPSNGGIMPGTIVPTPPEGSMPFDPTWPTEIVPSIPSLVTPNPIGGLPSGTIVPTPPEGSMPFDPTWPDTPLN